MPNIASVFKAEISRIARKELRTENDSLKKAVASQRAEIANLKRRLQDLERLAKRLAKGQDAAAKRAGAAPASLPAESNETGLRFRAAGMAANRKRLGLSAQDFALLVGTTGQSVYAWEAGKSRPRAEFLVAIAALRGIGKQEAAARLAALKV